MPHVTGVSSYSQSHHERNILNRELEDIVKVNILEECPSFKIISGVYLKKSRNLGLVADFK